MSARGDLFRREALEFHTRGETSSGGVIRLGAQWLRWSLRLLLVLLAAGVAADVLVRTNESATGPAVVDGRDGRIAALLPVAVAPQLRSARVLRIDLPGAHGVRVAVTRAYPVAAGTEQAGLPTPSQPELLLRGRIAAGRGVARRLVRARATLVLRSERLGEVVLRQFRSMLGRAGGTA